MGKALTPFAQARAALLANMLAEQAATDAFLGDVATKALTITLEEQQRMARMTDEQLADLGWTRHEINFAGHALLPPSESPMALRMAHERHVARLRSKGDRTEGSEGQAVYLPVAVETHEPKQIEGEDDE